MISFLLASALAAPEFAPIPVDHVVSPGVVLEGILVDEATYAELGRLRVETKALTREIKVFEEWKAAQDVNFKLALEAVKVEATSSQQRLVDHYEPALKAARRKDAFQRHGFSVGVAVGVVTTAVLTVAVLNVYDDALPVGITGS